MTLSETGETFRAQVHRIVIGQEETITLSFLALCLGGHVLIEGVPGTAKTLLARTIAQLVGGTFKRIQFTPDLMPSDIVGTSVYEIATSSFRMRLGPIFANIVLADEVNRAPAKTQSALLEAMEEKQVTLEGDARPLPDPFLVLATQNPVEYEGTYPLPEAELDRFLFKAIMRYPDATEEHAILRAHDQGQPLSEVGGLERLPAAALADARAEVDRVTVEDSVLDYVVRIVAETRKSPDLLLGASPRAGVHLLAAARATARLAGRAFVTPDDVAAVAPAVLRHRLILRPEAELERFRPDDAVQAALAGVPVPR